LLISISTVSAANINTTDDTNQKSNDPVLNSNQDSSDSNLKTDANFKNSELTDATEVKNFTQLKREITSSNDVKLNYTYYQYTASDGGSGNGYFWDITGKTIDGNGGTVDCNNAIFSEVMFYSNGNTILKNINFINYNSNKKNQYGAFLRIEGNNFLLENCNITNLNSASIGGVLRFQGNNFTIKNSNFDGITGANVGGFWIQYSTNIIMENSNFNNIKSTSTNPLILLDRTITNATIYNCNFTNYNCYNGGAIGAISKETILTLLIAGLKMEEVLILIVKTPLVVLH